MRRTTKVLASVILLGWIGCSTTQPAKPVAKDDEIYARVKTKLTESKVSSLSQVTVNVTNGVVTLSGDVPDETVKREAESQARSVEGVVAVNDDIQVHNP